jgi:signal transduction histidine kinase
VDVTESMRGTSREAGQRAHGDRKDGDPAPWAAAAGVRAVKRRLPLALCGLGAAGAAACLGWFAIDGAVAHAEARAAAAASGAARRVAAVERDLSRLGAALDGGPDGVADSFAALRATIARTLATEAMAQRLGPQDVELLARLAHDLDRAVAVSGAAGGAAALRDAAGRGAAPLADLADRLTAREDGAEAAVAGALDRAGRAAPATVAAAAALALALGALGFLMRPPRPAAAPTADLTDARAELAAQIEAARLAKARFVMMMSHELRTPMNGMLGLLSLMREYDPPDALKPLIDKAERAGRQLTAMLGDLLEVESAPPADPGPRADPAFSVEALAQSMRDVFGPAALTAGADFTVRVKGEVPAEATGDGVKLQRALTQLCSQVVDQAGVRDVALELSHTGEECRAELSFDHAAGADAGLKLVEPAPAPPAADEGLTAPGLGPLLARGLLEQMGGRLEVSTLDSGRILVLAAAPSRPIEGAAAEPARPRVRVIAQTRSLGALGAAAASAAGVDVLAAEDAPAPDVVLVEAGGEEEARALSEARAAWPAAVVIALGDPDAPAGFDGIVGAPLEPARVAREVAQAWARARGATARPLVSPTG